MDFAESYPKYSAYSEPEHTIMLKCCKHISDISINYYGVVIVIFLIV